MCGYPAAALLGTNLRMLQGTDRDQDGRARLARSGRSSASRRACCCATTAPTARCSGTRCVMQPVRSRGTAESFHRLSPRCQRAAEARRARQHRACRRGCARTASRGCIRAPTSRSCCSGTGTLAQRDSHEIGLTLFDIDDLGAYNDKFDRAAGDACIRRVARVIAPPIAAAATWSAAGRAAPSRCSRRGRPPIRPRSTRTWCAARARPADTSPARPAPAATSP